MVTFYLCEADPGPDWVYDRMHELEVAITMGLFGEDLAVSAEWNRTSHHDERTSLKGLLLALAGDAPDGVALGRFGLPEAPAEPGEILGAVDFTVPVLDNLHLVDDTFCQVRADVRRNGVGSALWTEVVRIARGLGRTTILGWSDHPLPDAETDVMASPTGVGRLPLDAGSRFALKCGLDLAQVERQSRLHLPVPADVLARLRASAERQALPGYRVESWTGPTPAQHRDRVAAMYRTLSTDAPLGDVDWQPEAWDAERVQHSDERKHLTGHSLYSLAIDEASGDAAGLTEIHVHDSHPHRPEQWTTVVAAAHRGHRLGLLLKVANLELLADDQPEARHLDTWNAGENDHMLAINTALGYRPHSAHGAWQLRC